MAKRSTTKRKVSKRIRAEADVDGNRLPLGGRMSIDQLRADAKMMARNELLTSCTWGSDCTPEEGLATLLEWVSNLMVSAEGHPSGAYKGTAELEREAQEEYERLRRILNRAIATKNPAAIDAASQKIRNQAAKYCEQWRSNGNPPGIAHSSVYALASLPQGFELNLPPFTDWLEMLPYANKLHTQMTKDGRPGLLRQLRRVPSVFQPKPYGPRQWACVSILRDLPTSEQIDGGDARSVADVIEAEYRRFKTIEKSEI